VSDVCHISSAVVTVFPSQSTEVIARLQAIPETEVHFFENGKIVIVLVGTSTGEIGSRLASIALMDGVISANLVFEHIDIAASSGAEA
jgi:nitrate reductase NapD